MVRSKVLVKINIPFATIYMHSFPLILNYYIYVFQTDQILRKGFLKHGRNQQQILIIKFKI